MNKAKSMPEREKDPKTLILNAATLMLLASIMTSPAVPGTLNDASSTTSLQHAIAPMDADLTHSSNFFLPDNPSPPPSNGEQAAWCPASTNEPRFMEHYSDLIPALGGDILELGIQAGDRHSALLDPDWALMDVTELPAETNDFQAVMQHVTKNLAARNTLVPRQDTDNYVTVVVYLLMAAVIVLVAIGRR